MPNNAIEVLGRLPPKTKLGKVWKLFFFLIRLNLDALIILTTCAVLITLAYDCLSGFIGVLKWYRRQVSE
jgi:hypothetical protein